MKSIFYCTSCDRVFKAQDDCKKKKCPKCTNIMRDLSVSDTDYSKLSAWEKEALKIKAIEMSENEKKYPLDNMLNCYDFPVITDQNDNTVINKTIAVNADKIKDVASEGKDLHSAVTNVYLKAQIYNQIRASENFIKICRSAALKDDGKIDKDESRILKEIETLTNSYNKGLNKLLQ